MGKKRKTQVFVLKPWCWYCEREFEDEKVLLQHQKSKHFKCQLCPRKLNTAGGLMVHSQQVHKCEPEPLTNTLPGRDGYDIEIFGMEGVPTNALAEWKARKETEAGSAAMAAAAAAQRPRQAYTVISEADLQAALAQHKALMASRNNPTHGFRPVFPPAHLPFPPNGFPAFPPPTLPMPTLPSTMPPPIAPALSNFQPPFPPNMPLGASPLQGANGSSSPAALRPAPPAFVPQRSGEADSSLVVVMQPKDGVIWPDNEASPAEKRAQQTRYRYASPTPGNPDMLGSDIDGLNRKRKAAADFL